MSSASFFDFDKWGMSWLVLVELNWQTQEREVGRLP